MKNEIVVSSRDLFWLLLDSGRYSWMRSSTAASTAAELIQRYARHLPRENVEQILKELREAQHNWVKSETTAYPQIKQRECDRKTMADLDRWLVEIIPTLEKYM